MAAVIPVLVLAAMVFALVDIIMRDEWQVKHLPKFGWLLLVIFLPLIGTALWFAIGREYGGRSASEGLRTLMPQRPTQLPGPIPPAASLTTEEQLAELDREIEYYRKRAELDQLKRESEGDPA